MAVKTGTISYTGSYYRGNSGKWMSLGVGMNAQEYPTKIEIKGMTSSVGWESTTDGSVAPHVYLCDNSDGGTQTLIINSYMSGYSKPRGEAWRIFELSAEDQKQYKGKSLAIIATGAASGYLTMRGNPTVEVTTDTDVYTVTINQQTGGTMTADKAAAYAGETITLTAVPDTGYKRYGYTILPSGVEKQGYTFVMPEADVTITPTFSKIDYNVRTIVSPLEEAGTITVQQTATYGEEVSVSQTPGTGYTFSRWSLSNGGTVTNGKFTMPAADIYVTAHYMPNTYTITKVVSPSGAGTISAPSSMQYGESVTIGQTPATGYQFEGWTVSETATLDGNTLTIGDGDITLTATYSKIVYTVTMQINKPGAGTLSSDTTATYGDTVSLTQTPATGYYFDGWTLSSGGTVTNNSFSMPAENVTVTANYLHRSEAWTSDPIIPTSRLVWNFWIESESTEYTHRYRLVVASLASDWTTVDSGRTQYSRQLIVTHTFANAITTSDRATAKIEVETYRGETLIGTYELTGLTYLIDDAQPAVVGVPSRTNTADGVTYANLGVYVQGHNGVSVTAYGTTYYNATIASIRIRVLGYEGEKYDKTFTTFTNSSCTLETGFLTRAGENIIEMTITDSRGLTGTSTKKVTVNAYAAPSITEFECWRCDSSGDPDDTGEMAQFSAGYTYTDVGSNAVTRSLTVYGITETINVDTGWILPSSRQNFPGTQTAEITYTVSDLLESTSVTIRLDTRQFIMHFNASGTSVAFGHAVQETPTSGSGYTGTFEIDGNMEPWIGNMTLKDYILGVVNGTI